MPRHHYLLLVRPSPSDSHVSIRNDSHGEWQGREEPKRRWGVLLGALRVTLQLLFISNILDGWCDTRESALDFPHQRTCLQITVIQVAWVTSRTCRDVDRASQGLKADIAAEARIVGGWIQQYPPESIWGPADDLDISFDVPDLQDFNGQTTILIFSEIVEVC